jgi:glucokinase
VSAGAPAVSAGAPAVSEGAPAVSEGGPVLAVDIGGTKIAAGLVHPDGTVENLCRAVTQPPGATAQSIAQSVVRTVRQASAGRRVTAIGVASAGPLDPVTGIVAPINIAPWAGGYPLLAVLAEAFPAARTALVGDAAAAALGEYRFGAGRGARSMLGMVVSTGVGGGLVLDGRLYQGPLGNAGHVGHLPAGPEFASCGCRCGATGCVEASASGSALAAWAAANGRPGLTAESLATAARALDPVAVQAYRRAALALARAVQLTGLLCDLDVVVIGGGVAQAGEVLFEPLRAFLAGLPGLGFARRPAVHPTVLSGTAGLLGAALVAADSPPAGPVDDPAGPVDDPGGPVDDPGEQQELTGAR